MMFRDFYRTFCNFLQDVPKRGFWRVDGGKLVRKWKWRLDNDVKGSRTWWMRLRCNWICSRMEEAMMHKNVEIRARWEKYGK